METQRSPRKRYPTDVSDDEWAFAAPYVDLVREDGSQRVHDPREVDNVLRWVVHTGAPWRYLPGDLPSRPAVYQRARRRLDAGCFEAMAHDPRGLLRRVAGRAAQPTGAAFDSATRRSTPESGHRAGSDGHKRRKGSKRHLAVDTLGHPLALRITPADAQDRGQVGEPAAVAQAAAGEAVEVAFVDQGSTGERPAAAAAARGIRLGVVKLEEAKRGFVLLPRRWVVERSFAWTARFRRLAKDYERLPEPAAGPHFVAFVSLMLHRPVAVVAESP